MSVTLTLSPSETIPEPEPLTLLKKWRQTYKKDRAKSRSAWTTKILFCAMAVTLLYTAMRFLIPYSYGHHGPWTVYYMKVLAVFFFVNNIGNFMCLIFYDTSIKKTRDRPDLSRHLWDRPPEKFVPYLYNQSQNGHLQQIGVNGCLKKERDSDTKDGLSWSYCAACQLDIPPRAHHCSVCKKCVLKRDHHCYMTGVCIGHYNQRYFIVMTFYTTIICSWGFYLTRSYAMGHFWEHVTWWDFVPPLGLYKMVFGDLEHEVFFMVQHLWITAFFALFAFMYFTGQMTLVAMNKTLYEFTKIDPYRSTTSINRNFRSVFGDFWALNFIFPAQIIFRQTDDGYHWDGLKAQNTSVQKC